MSPGGGTESQFGTGGGGLAMTIDNTFFGIVLLVGVVGAFFVSCIWRMYVARDRRLDDTSGSNT